ncbi:hypothetical protein PCANC_15668 [Puccinia coronata f. sp. avenae]|uniref:Uncharacterized protein n=1 Tax=Puccinia coronata f. sp. avenae TaxID=200324 RepID=A0A2N5SQK7_9BASI|nr:hypothetical protein PCANC_15668 [Puccinia coronata f. sp. avenae]
MEAEPTVHSSLELFGQISSTSGHLNTQLDELLDGESTDAIVEDGRTTTSCGISLLDLKNHLLTSYLHNLTNLLIVRISQTNGIPLQTPEKAAGLSSSQIVQQLVWLRLVFERVRPLESKLKYQIDKLLKTVQELDQHSFSNPSAEIDHMMNDPLSFKPNLAALEAPQASEQQEGDAHMAPILEKDGRQIREEGRSQEIYRPPRVAPVAYPEANPNNKSKRMAPAPVALREHVSLASTAPLPESTTGLSNTAAKSSNRAKALARMNEYEEENMTRLFSTKKDARRRRNDEAAIALGIESSAASKDQKRKLGALEGEFDGVLSEIAKKSDHRYSDHLGSANLPHKKLSTASKSPGFGPSSGNRKFKKKGAFDKALKKISK